MKKQWGVLLLWRKAILDGRVSKFERKCREAQTKATFIIGDFGA